MASALRLLNKFTKNFTSISNIPWAHINRNFVYCNGIFTRRATLLCSKSDRYGCFYSTTKQEDFSTLQRIWGGHKKILLMLEEAIKKGSMTNYESVEFLNITSAVLSWESKETCNEVLDKVWLGILSLGVVPTTAHFRIMFTARMRAGVEVSPTEILMEVQNRGLSVDLRLCQILIDAYTELGDIESTTTVFNLMKENNLRLNADILTTMMKGYILTRNEEGIADVQSTMDSMHVNLSPSQNTRLLVAYAKMGNMTKVEHLLKEFNVLTPRSLFPIYSALVESDHNELASQFFASMKDYTTDLVCIENDLKVIFKLLQRGRAEEAFNLLLWSIENLNKWPGLLAKTFIVFSVRYDRPLNEIFERITQLNRRDANVSVRDVIFAANLHQKTLIFKELHSQLSEQSPNETALKNMIHSTSVPEIYKMVPLLSPSGLPTKLTVVLTLLSKGEKLSDIKEKITALRIPLSFLSTPSQVCRAAGTVQLESIYKYFGISEDTVDSVVQLVENYCKDGMIEDAKTVLDALDVSGVELNTGQASSLVKVCANCEAFVERVQKYSQLLYNPNWEHPNIGTALVLTKVHIEQGHIPAALEVLQNVKTDPYLWRRSRLHELHEDIVTACAKVTGHQEHIQSIMTLLYKLFMGQPTKEIKDRVKKNGIGGRVLGTVLSCNYQLIWLVPTFAMLLGKSASDSELEKVFQIGCELYGSSSAHQALTFSYILSGKPTDAKQVLQGKDLEADKLVLQNGCRYLRDQDMLTELEQFVDCTKHLVNVDRDQVLYELIQIHYKRGDWKSALDVYRHYREDNVEPSVKTAELVRDALESANQPLLPELTEILSKVTVSLTGELENSLKTEDIKSCCHIIERMTVRKMKISRQQLLRVVFLCQKHNENNTLWQLARIVSLDVDVDSLMVILPELPKHQQKAAAQQLFRHAIENNRESEVVSLIENWPGQLGYFVSLYLLEYLAKHSTELYQRIEKAIISGEDVHATGFLVQYYLQSEQYDKLHLHLANKVHLINPAYVLRGLASSLYVRADRQDLPAERKELPHMEKASIELLEFVKEKDRSKLPGIYNHLILFKLSKYDWQGAVQYFAQCLCEGFKLRDINYRTLKKMEVLLLENNQALPWTKEAMNVRNTPGVTFEVEEASSDEDNGAESSTTQHTKS